MNIMELFKRDKHDKDMLLRDITGECEGECRDRVREGEDDRQHKIDLTPFEEIKSYPNVTWAHNRNETPDVWGGIA
ncbi:MAG: hypothetical protein C4518_00205 [Desulfobacteraceae bacterium]|nr:MAG: hypothetical protein C4518_00205 [Desulfobacteraceae bacterium]